MGFQAGGVKPKKVTGEDKLFQTVSTQMKPRGAKPPWRKSSQLAAVFVPAHLGHWPSSVCACAGTQARAHIWGWVGWSTARVLHLDYLRMTTLTSDLQGAEEKHSWPQLVLSPQHPSLSLLAPRSGLEVTLPPTRPGPDTTEAGAVWWFAETAPLYLLVSTNLAFTKTLFIRWCTCA